MQQDTSDIILAELRELRADFNDFARKSGERLSSLERDNYALLGNGQPGRIALIEAAVETLKQWRWKVVGIATGVSGVCSVLAWILFGK